MTKTTCPEKPDHMALQLQQLRRRVLNMRSGGMPDGQIRAGLVQEGWDASAIQVVMEGGR